MFLAAKGDTSAMLSQREQKEARAFWFAGHLRQFLLDDHDAVLINDIVDTLDLSPLYRKATLQGCTSCHPAIFMKILVYAYSLGVLSSRKIQNLLQESIAFIYLASWQRPDFQTIRNFRRDHLPEVRQLFCQYVEINLRLGLVLPLPFADAESRHRVNAAGRAIDWRASGAREIESLLEAADQVDAYEDLLFGNADRQSLPAQLRNQKSRLKMLQTIQINV